MAKKEYNRFSWDKPVVTPKKTDDMKTLHRIREHKGVSLDEINFVEETKQRLEQVKRRAK